MADFFTELWTSIFTPGPTPTLVVATNASFAVLQLVLLALLAATRSVHFIILSVLCAGLWWSINWFVREINALKEAERLNKKTDQPGQSDGADTAATADSEDTETEEVTRQSIGLRKRQAASAATSPAAAAAAAATATATATAPVGSAPIASTAVSRGEEADMLASTSSLSVHSMDSRHRTSTGNVSGTDSEWDKLDSEAE